MDVAGGTAENAEDEVVVAVVENDSMGRSQRRAWVNYQLMAPPKYQEQNSTSTSESMYSNVGAAAQQAQILQQLEYMLLARMGRARAPHQHDTPCLKMASSSGMHSVE